MKKIIIALSALLVASAGSAMAQTDSTKTAKDRLSEIEQMTVDVKKHKSASTENDVFEVNALAHAGLGKLYIQGDSFSSKDGFSNELFLNVFDLAFNPVPVLSINAGLDVKWNRFVSKSQHFFVVDNTFVAGMPGYTAPDDIESRLCGFALSVPATISLNLGYTSIRVGAEASYNIDKFNKVKSFYSTGGSNYKQVTKGGEFEKFTISYIASIDFDGLGAYFKYCPKSMIPGSNIIKSYMAFGVVLMM